MGRSMYPGCLLIVALTHAFSNAIRVCKRPRGQLMQNSDLSKDVEIVKLLRSLVLSERIALRGFRHILTTRVFVKYFGPI